MNFVKALKLDRLFQRCVTVLLSIGFMITIFVSYSSTAQAAVDTTSAASKGDAARINQRKEEAPHYPNWYTDQRSLESYMDEADVNPIGTNRKNAGVRSDIQNNQEDQGNLIEQAQERFKDVAGSVQDMFQSNASPTPTTDNSQDYTQPPNWYRNLESGRDEGDRNQLIERSQDKLKGIADNAREALQPNSTRSYKDYRDSIDASRPSTQDLGERVNERLERVKETFQEATERSNQGKSGMITGETSR